MAHIVSFINHKRLKGCAIHGFKMLLTLIEKWKEIFLERVRGAGATSNFK